jgi:hypothetical protein
MGAFCGRQHRQSPETKVSVAGHRGGMDEPEDKGREPGSPPRSPLAATLPHMPDSEPLVTLALRTIPTGPQANPR